MKTFHKPLLITSLFVALGTLAPAHAMGPGMGGGPCLQQDGMRGGRAGNPEQWQARHTQHLAALKAKLALTPDQEAAWSAFAAASPPAAGRAMSAPSDRAALRAEMDKLSTPERLDKMQTLRNQRQTEMNAAADKHAQAVKTFYAVLTAEQKKVFDSETARFGAAGAGRAGRMGPMRGQPQN